MISEKMIPSDNTFQEKLILENDSKAINIEVRVAVILLQTDFVCQRGELMLHLAIGQVVAFSRSDPGIDWLE